MVGSNRDDEIQRMMVDPAWIEFDAIPPIVLTVGPRPALMLLAQLQLALRHPGNKSVAADMARSLARTIEKHLSVNPTIASFCEKGWRPGGGQ